MLNTSVDLTFGFCPVCYSFYTLYNTCHFVNIPFVEVSFQRPTLI